LWINLVQEERVATYRFFDEGLERVLGSSSSGAKSENMEGYSGVCAEATASFAALSNLVNAVEGLVKEQDKSHAAIGSIIRKVTNALHTYEGHSTSYPVVLHTHPEDMVPLCPGSPHSACTAAFSAADLLLSVPGRQQVQLQEKEKLSVTAALHLEKVRLRDAGGEHALLREGVDRLQKRLDGTKHAIVELLDELKYETEPLFCDE
jgi:hypothetical protein